MFKFRRILSIAIGVLLLVALLPASAIAEGVRDDRLLAVMEQEAALVDAILLEKDGELYKRGCSPKETVDALILVAEEHPLVTQVYREDADTFGYTLASGVECVYDYVIMHGREEAVELDFSELMPAKGAAEKVYHFSSDNLNVGILSPYYGIDDGFPDYYFNTFGPIIAQYTGGNCSSFVGNSCNVNTFKTIGNYGTVIIDSHGTFYNGRSYIAVYNTTGILASDYTNGYAVALSGGGCGINGFFFDRYLGANALPDSFIHISTCSGAKDGLLPATLLEKGATVTYGYDNTVTVAYDIYMAQDIYNSMRGVGTGVEYLYNIGQAVDYAKSRQGDYDPYYYESYGEYTYPRLTGEERWYLPPGRFTLSDLDISVSDVYLAQVGDVTTFTVHPVHMLSECIYSFSLHGSDVVSIESSNDGFGRAITVTANRLGGCTIYITVTDKFYGGSITREIPVVVGATFDGALNIEGGNIDFITGGQYPWTIDNTSFEGRIVGKSTNVGVHSSTSTVSCTVDMLAGQSLVFDWNVSCEDTYDNLIFYVNDEQELMLQNGANPDGDGWVTDVYWATEAGSYTFSWTYSKDGSVSARSDCGYLDNVYIDTDVVPLYDVTFVDGFDGSTVGEMIVGEGTVLREDQFPYIEGHTGWIFDGWDYDFVTPITGDTTFTAEWTPRECTVEFIDGLSNELIGSIVVDYGTTLTADMFPTPPTHSGYVFAGWDYDGQPITGFYTTTVITALYTEAPPYIPGDVDGDGVVSAVDALAALRHSMGMLTLSGDMLLRADVDGNGTVNAADALLIIRLSMGI
ncbi:MAG: dockerin type I repeat-containing protein [Clostridia bacterium]|nr:dockerin type I repeat-containing protein [Clostridia bacterium]